MSSFFVSYRRRFNLDEVLREWAAEQVATNRDQRDPRRSGEETVGAADGAAEEDEVRRSAGKTQQWRNAVLKTVSSFSTNSVD